MAAPIRSNMGPARAAAAIAKRARVAQRLAEGPQAKRWCPHCPGGGQFKPIGEFYRNRSMPDGHSGWCRSCTLAAQRRRNAAQAAARAEAARRAAAQAEAAARAANTRLVFAGLMADPVPPETRALLLDLGPARAGRIVARAARARADRVRARVEAQQEREAVFAGWIRGGPAPKPLWPPPDQMV